MDENLRRALDAAQLINQQIQAGQTSGVVHLQDTPIDDTALMHAVFSFLSWLNSMHDIALVNLIDHDTGEDTVKPHYELSQGEVRNMIEHYFSNTTQ